MRVVVHGDDFTLAGTESELWKIKPKMCDWHDVEVRGIVGGGRRDVLEIEISGRSLRWAKHKQSLEYEAGDKHRQALLRGMECAKLTS